VPVPKKMTHTDIIMKMCQRINEGTGDAAVSLAKKYLQLDLSSEQLTKILSASYEIEEDPEALKQLWSGEISTVLLPAACDTFGIHIKVWEIQIKKDDVILECVSFMKSSQEPKEEWVMNLYHCFSECKWDHYNLFVQDTKVRK